MRSLQDIKIGIIGLGYVGLPLAVEFSKKYPTLGFDINTNRINALKAGIDNTCEIESIDLKNSKDLTFTNIQNDLKDCNVYIVTVPTPINIHNQPDLSPLLKASEVVGSLIQQNDVVIYESTVYPGATEDDCIPIIEKISKLKYNMDFFAGYSPERINPGDKKHRLTDILKVTSGSNEDVAKFVNSLYASIIIAGTHLAQNIKVAEAAKIIENTQRDVNIALINEFSIIFNKMGIDTQEVLEAAETKWNFLPFRPGLVGGHCIGVDPYYLTHKAQSLGYYPEMILAGRRLNNGMANYVVSQLVKQMLKSKIQVEGSTVLIMGITFKENCPDIRNTKVVDIISELKQYNINSDIFDPICNGDEVKIEYGYDIIEQPKPDTYDAIILTVAHDDFMVMGIDAIKQFGKIEHVLFDLKYLFKKNQSDIRI